QLQPSMTDTPMVRVGPNVQERKLLQKPEPVYPAAAREARIQGTVRFNVLLSADGAIENAQLVSGHPLLIAAAQEALRGYRYEPTLLNGSPARVVTLVDIRFTLQ
ncbi:MAG: TonB family protein, partial [Bryobacteraceae bacterium]|nr:TonB family protein [Bryobacteraceae bacterium]